MSGAADSEQDKKPKTDANESIEDGLNADAIDYVNEEAESQQKGYDLQPNERAARTFWTGGLALINEFLKLAKILGPFSPN